MELPPFLSDTSIKGHAISYRTRRRNQANIKTSREARKIQQQHQQQNHQHHSEQHEILKKSQLKEQQQQKVQQQHYQRQPSEQQFKTDDVSSSPSMGCLTEMDFIYIHSRQNSVPSHFSTQSVYSQSAMSRMTPNCDQVFQFPISYHSLGPNGTSIVVNEMDTNICENYIVVNAPTSREHFITQQRNGNNLTLNAGSRLQDLDEEVIENYVELQNYTTPSSYVTFAQQAHATAETPPMTSSDNLSSVVKDVHPNNDNDMMHIAQQRFKHPDQKSTSFELHYSNASPHQQSTDNSCAVVQQSLVQTQTQQPSDSVCESPTISVDDDGSGSLSNIDNNHDLRDSTNTTSANTLGHVTRTPPQTLEWLRNNYEPYEGASLPRCTLYEHYKGHCRVSGLEPVNAASFGKLIRSVFKGLRTRRLGTRGNSKYHYNGIRIKESSSLLQIINDDEYGSNISATARNSFRRRISAQNDVSQQNRFLEHSSPVTPAYNMRKRNLGAKYTDNLRTNENVMDYAVNNDAYDRVPDEKELLQSADENYIKSSGSTSSTTSRLSNATVARSSIEEALPHDAQSCHSNSSSTMPATEPKLALGNGQLPSVPAPNLDELEGCLLTFGYSIPHVLKFMDAYTVNCTKILDAIKHLQFEAVEEIWMSFWHMNKVTNVKEKLSESATININQLVIYQLSTLPQMQKYMETMDVALYQVLVEVLIPDVLRSTLTPRLSCQIRNFAKNVESWLRKALSDMPSDLKMRKITAVRFLANALTRYTSFNHLADAARAVLRNSEQVLQMYNDFCKVDFSIVRGQADWVCDCDGSLVSSIESEFKENLKHQRNLDEWTEWMEAVVDQVLAKYHDKPLPIQMNASKQFLLKWSFYSSMILRDVTYRSAQSFGSFHLIRLLYDEYMCLMVEMRLARITNQPTICVMRQDLNILHSIPSLQSQLSYDSNRNENATLINTYYTTMPLTSTHHLPIGVPMLNTSVAHNVDNLNIESSNSLSSINNDVVPTGRTIFELSNSSRYDNHQPIGYSNIITLSEYPTTPSQFKTQQLQHSQQQRRQSVEEIQTNSDTFMVPASSIKRSNSEISPRITCTEVSSAVSLHYSISESPSVTYSSSITHKNHGTGEGCPELNEILVQDSSLSTMNYTTQRINIQSDKARSDNSSHFEEVRENESMNSHYVILHQNPAIANYGVESTNKNLPSNMPNSRIDINPYYHHSAPTSHLELARIVYMADEEDIMDSIPHQTVNSQHALNQRQQHTLTKLQYQDQEQQLKQENSLQKQRSTNSLEDNAIAKNVNSLSSEVTVELKSLNDVLIHDDNLKRTIINSNK